MIPVFLRLLQLQGVSHAFSRCLKRVSTWRQIAANYTAAHFSANDFAGRIFSQRNVSTVFSCSIFTCLLPHVAAFVSAKCILD
jgi:hypothetical protein